MILIWRIAHFSKCSGICH